MVSIKITAEMKFLDFENAVSPPRLARYLNATGGNRAKALYLYRVNVHLGQEMYGLLGLFEVVLRNAIDRHYANQFSDPDWLIHQCAPSGMFSYPALVRSRFLSRTVISESYHKLGSRYDRNALLASLNFGLWCYLFAPIEFRAGGQTLHQVFHVRPRGTHSTLIFNDLEKLRFCRNRIAHHEPIIFDASGINTAPIKSAYQNLCEKTLWLGFQPNQLFRGLDHTDKWFRLIDHV